MPASAAPPTAPLPGTNELTESTPLSDRILDGAKAFLLDQWEKMPSSREATWRMKLADPTRFEEHQEQIRQALIEITGAHDPRTTPAAPQWVRSLRLDTQQENSSLPADSALQIRPIEWNVLSGLTARGLWIGIPNRNANATIILRPDAGVTLHAIAGHVDSGSEPSVADRSTDATKSLVIGLCSVGFDVIVVQPISRTSELRRNRVELTDQEYVYRLTNVLGRHPIGLEIQTIRSLVDWLSQSNDKEKGHSKDQRPIGLIGHGDGGLIAMLTAAMDTRVDAVMTSGGWGNLESLWQQPIGRNIFNLMTNVSDAELAAMIAPRKVIVEAAGSENYEISGRGAAPAKWNAPSIGEVKQAQERLHSLYSSPPSHVAFVYPADSQGSAFIPLGTEAAREQFIRILSELRKHSSNESVHSKPIATANQAPFEIPDTQLPWSSAEARSWQLRSIERLAETWVAESRDLREQWVSALDTSSIENFETATIPHRERLERDVIGRFDLPLLPANARSRKWRESEKWTGFEIEVDVFENVVGGGILLVPNDLHEGERRPLVV